MELRAFSKRHSDWLDMTSLRVSGRDFRNTKSRVSSTEAHLSGHSIELNEVCSSAHAGLCMLRSAGRVSQLCEGCKGLKLS